MGAVKQEPSPVLDAAAVKAFAHPLRVRLYYLLDADGPATASGLAGRVGESSGSTSYHLRQLARHGVIVEVEGRGTAKERWWQTNPAGFTVRGDHLRRDPATAAAADLLLGEFVRQRLAESQAWLRGGADRRPGLGRREPRPPSRDGADALGAGAARRGDRGGRRPLPAGLHLARPPGACGRRRRGVHQGDHAPGAVPRRRGCAGAGDRGGARDDRRRTTTGCRAVPGGARRPRCDRLVRHGSRRRGRGRPVRRRRRQHRPREPADRRRRDLPRRRGAGVRRGRAGRDPARRSA